VELRLFGCWEVRAPTGLVEMGGREQRLIAFLALHGRKPRTQVAGVLWPDTTESRARTSLRAAVLRIRRSLTDVLDVGRTTLALAADVRVDVHELQRLVAERAAAGTEADQQRVVQLLRDADLLPGWYEEWVVVERERLLHLRLRALEALAHDAVVSGAFDLAFLAAREAVALDPLRESAHVLAIRAQLLGGNQPGAVQEYRLYRQQLQQVLDIRPSPEIDALVRQLPRPRGGSSTPRAPA
jgi:DNA-binding SARP family transcriptional activator